MKLNLIDVIILTIFCGTKKKEKEMCWEWDGVIWGLIGMQMAAVSSGQATKKRQRVVCACPRYLWKSGQNQNVWLARRSPRLSQTARITDRLTRRKNGPCKRRGMSAIGRRWSTLIHFHFWIVLVEMWCKWWRHLAASFIHR